MIVARSGRSGRQHLPSTEMPLAELASLRYDAYRLLATLLLYPNEERLQLAAAAATLGGSHEALAGFAFYPQWQRLLATLRELAEKDVTWLQAQYLRTFSVNPTGTLAPPYESFYVSSDGQATPWIQAQLDREYAAAGLSLTLPAQR